MILERSFFYRKFCSEEANRLGLKGHVRNLANGDVEVLVEGEHTAIDELELLLKKGPQYSQIRNVLREEKKWSGDFKEFKVLRI